MSRRTVLEPGYLVAMTSSPGHDQDSEPPTPDGREPEVVSSDDDDPGGSGQGGADEPASHPDPEPGSDHTGAGSDS